MRTTLLSGVLMCIEVETSPRHHKQRRASLVYLRSLRQVKQYVELAAQGVEKGPVARRRPAVRVERPQGAEKGPVARRRPKAAGEA